MNIRLSLQDFHDSAQGGARASEWFLASSVESTQVLGLAEFRLPNDKSLLETKRLIFMDDACADWISRGHLALVKFFCPGLAHKNSGAMLQAARARPLQNHSEVGLVHFAQVALDHALQEVVHRGLGDGERNRRRRCHRASQSAASTFFVRRMYSGGHSAVYDSVNNRMIKFGGCLANAFR